MRGNPPHAFTLSSLRVYSSWLGLGKKNLYLALNARGLPLLAGKSQSVDREKPTPRRRNGRRNSLNDERKRELVNCENVLEKEEGKASRKKPHGECNVRRLYRYACGCSRIHTVWLISQSRDTKSPMTTTLYSPLFSSPFSIKFNFLLRAKIAHKMKKFAKQNKKTTEKDFSGSLWSKKLSFKQ